MAIKPKDNAGNFKHLLSKGVIILKKKLTQQNSSLFGWPFVSFQNSSLLGWPFVSFRDKEETPGECWAHGSGGSHSLVSTLPLAALPSAALGNRPWDQQM